MHVIVVGGGVAGLGSAMVLARQGHEVTVVERDPTPMPASADEAFEWDRRGAPQVRHSHAFLASLVGLLKKDYLHYSRSQLEIEIMRQIKRVFDPQGIMNPGKIFEL